MLKIIVLLYLLFVSVGSSAKSSNALILKSDTVFLILKAEFSLQNKSYQSAYKDYQQVYAWFPSEELAKTMLHIASITKNSVWEEESLVKLLAFKPTDKPLNQFYLQALVDQNKEVKAKVQAEYFLSLHEVGEYQAYKNLAIVLAQTENHTMAKKILLEVTQKETTATLDAQALFYNLTKDYEKALKVITKSNGKSSASTQTAFLYSDILYSQGKKSESIQFLQDYLKKSPDKTLDIALVTSLVKEKRYKESVEVYQRLLISDKERRYKWQMDLGTSYILDGELELAQSTIKEALEGDSLVQKERDRAYYSLGLIAEDQGQAAEALSYYEKVKSGAFEMPVKIRQAQLVAKDNKEEALAILESIGYVDLENYNTILLVRAQIFETHEDWKAVYKTYTDILEVEDNMQFHYARAIAAEKMGDIKLMEQDFLAIIKKDSANYEALNALGYSLAENTGRYEEALGYIDRALKLKPKAFHILDSMGWVKFKLKEYNEAVKFLQQAFLAKQDAEVAAHLAMVFKRQGKEKLSDEYLKQALKINKNNPTVIKIQKILSTQE